MNKEMDKLIKIDSMITEVELKAKVIDVILQDQENAYFDVDGDWQRGIHNSYARSGSNKKLQRNRNDQRTIIKTGRAVKAIC